MPRRGQIAKRDVLPDPMYNSKPVSYTHLDVYKRQDLKMYQCGLPKEMALELFKPFVMKRLVDQEIATNIKNARKMVDLSLIHI